MSVREVTVVVLNHTNEELGLDESSLRLDRGEWLAPESKPPREIPAGESGIWRCKTHGLAGIEGSAHYRVVGRDPSEKVTFTWVAHFIVPNKYTHESSVEGYRIRVLGGEGRHAVAVFIFEPVALPS
ncbi:hypothetical protein RB595_002135 [Gaeumannomyces hyphopodioides]